MSPTYSYVLHYSYFQLTSQFLSPFDTSHLKGKRNRKEKGRISLLGQVNFIISLENISTLYRLTANLTSTYVLFLSKSWQSPPSSSKTSKKSQMFKKLSTFSLIFTSFCDLSHLWAYGNQFDPTKKVFTPLSIS